MPGLPGICCLKPEIITTIIITTNIIIVVITITTVVTAHPPQVGLPGTCGSKQTHLSGTAAGTPSPHTGQSRATQVKEKQTNRQTDKQINQQKDKQTDKQTKYKQTNTRAGACEELRK